MTKSKPKPQTPTPPTSMEILGARLQKAINSPVAQKERAVVIHKAADESQDDWDLIIEAITETDGVYVTFLDDVGVRIFWDVPDKD
jgi:hypothetical protein